MRNILVLLFSGFAFFICQSYVLGQTREQKLADEYFFDKNYQKAKDIYLKIVKKRKSSCYVNHQIGDCYKYLNQHEQAIEWYKKALLCPQSNKEIYLTLSQEYRWFGKYEKADKYIREFNKNTLKGTDSVHISYEKIIPELKKDSSNFIIKNMNVFNSVNSDICPTFYMNNLVFTSDRKVFSPINRTDIRNGTHFYNLYISKRESAFLFSEPVLFDKNLTTLYNDGPISFNDNYTKAFLTCNFKSNNSSKRDLNVVVSEKKGDIWNKELTPLFVTNGNYSYMHAFLSSDNKRLFYVSDRPGGYGGFDIYYSYIKNGFLSAPINLGPDINTSYNEMFPFISGDSILYFSSDRLEGLGGLDIYFANEKDNEFSRAINIGYPLNSSKDDFGLIFLRDSRSGYFVSNRPGGVGNDDIYSFRMKDVVKKDVPKKEVQKKPVPATKDSNIQEYVGEIGDLETGEPIIGADIILYEDGVEVIRVKTDDEGKFSFSCNKNGVYIVEVDKYLYQTKTSKLVNLVDLSKNDNSIFLFLKKY